MIKNIVEELIPDVTIADLDNALNLDFDDVTVTDASVLDERFEEEDLPDDPFVVEYESELFDADKRAAAEADIAELRKQALLNFDDDSENK